MHRRRDDTHVHMVRPSSLSIPRKRMRIGSATRIGGFASLCVIVLAGCAQTRDTQPATDVEQLGEVQLVHFLHTVPLVRFDQVCRAVTLTMDGEDRFDSHAARAEYLADKDVIRKAWGLAAGDRVDAGTLAFMLTQICQVRPSASSLLLGSWGLGDRRYALRTAVEEGLMRRGAPHRLITGGELVLALAKADEYMAGKQLYTFGADVDAPEDVNAAKTP